MSGGLLHRVRHSGLLCSTRCCWWWWNINLKLGKYFLPADKIFHTNGPKIFPMLLDYKCEYWQELTLSILWISDLHLSSVCPLTQARASQLNVCQINYSEIFEYLVFLLIKYYTQANPARSWPMKNSYLSGQPIT